MAGTLRIKRLEAELESLRSELYQIVNGNPSRLKDSRVLPISQKLDLLIIEIQREKKKMAKTKTAH